MQSNIPETDNAYADLKQRDPCGYAEFWVEVLYDAIEGVRQWNSRAGKEFIFDSENIFFDAAADFLGYEPDGLRDRIRAALERPGSTFTTVHDTSPVQNKDC